MPLAIARRHFSPYADAPMDASPLLTFNPMASPNQMLFTPADDDDDPFPPRPPSDWDPYMDFDPPSSVISTPSTLDSPPNDFEALLEPEVQNDFEVYDGIIPPYYSSPEWCSSVFDAHNRPRPADDMYISDWVNDSELGPAATPSSPISIPFPTSNTQFQPSFEAYNHHAHFPHNMAKQPAEFDLMSLPRSLSPNMTFNTMEPTTQGFASISPQDTSADAPAWASRLWDTPSSPQRTSPVSRPQRHSPMNDATQRQRIPIRRTSITSGQLFQSASAPSGSQTRAHGASRAYSRRAESASVNDDHDATVRRKKRVSLQEEPQATDKASESPPLKSLLRPPKLAPSAWQLYFTDWIQRQQMSASSRKLNVAQAAKEAGLEYGTLSPEEKEPYKRRSQAAKEARERDHAEYMRKLTPDDIKRENAFRAAQRKAGKSRKSNIKDPNAPKKPLSAYFMFLQRIRADPLMVEEVFGDETETTKQSVLAAAKWRSMTDDERKPFLAQAEQEKLDYEAARRLYEEGTVGYPSSINFSILPGSPAETAFRASRAVKAESESESEGFATDDGIDNHIRS